MSAQWTDDSKTKEAKLDFQQADYAAPSWIDRNSRRKSISAFVTGALLLLLILFAAIGLADTLLVLVK